jgi:hypothetical protein
VSAVRFSWALIEQRKRNNPLCESGGSVAAFGLVLARCARCRVMLGAVQCCALCSACGGGWLFVAWACCVPLQSEPEPPSLLHCVWLFVRVGELWRLGTTSCCRTQESTRVRQESTRVRRLAPANVES